MRKWQNSERTWSHNAPLAPQLFPHGPEQRAAQLLDLVHEKGQHHQHGEHHRQVLLPVPEVVLVMITLVLERVEGFVLDPPPRPSTAGKQPGIAERDMQIGDPREVLDAFSVGVELVVLQKVHAQILIRLVQRHAVHPRHLGRVVPFLPRQFRRAPSAAEFLHLLEQKRMIPWFDAQNKVHPVVQQVADVGAVAGQTILDDDELQMRMLLADFGQQSLRRVPLAVVLGGASCFWIGSGARGMTSLRSGCTITAPSIWCW